MLARLGVIAATAALLSAHDKEAALGARVADEVRKSTTALGDSAVEDYVQRVGLRLADQAGSREWQWEIAVIRDVVGGRTHEPLSIPGGHIFVPAQLIMASESETELAGMLAHAMAHVTRRHAIKGGDGASLIFMAGWMGDRTTLPATFAKTQRADELDADRAAVDMITAAGYNPEALISYLRRSQAEERVRALESLPANAAPPRNPPAAEFDRIRNRVQEIMQAPENPPKPPPSLRKKNAR